MRPKLNDLWGRFKTGGDEQAGERLVLHYTLLVREVAGGLRSFSLQADIEEGLLVSYGMPGLRSAVDEFDVASG